MKYLTVLFMYALLTGCATPLIFENKNSWGETLSESDAINYLQEASTASMGWAKCEITGEGIRTINIASIVERTKGLFFPFEEFEVTGGTFNGTTGMAIVTPFGNRNAQTANSICNFYGSKHLKGEEVQKMIDALLTIGVKPEV